MLLRYLDKVVVLHFFCIQFRGYNYRFTKAFVFFFLKYRAMSPSYLNYLEAEQTRDSGQIMNQKRACMAQEINPLFTIVSQEARLL